MSAAPRETPSPSEYRASNPHTPPPPEYQPPSMLAEYKYLALAFAAVLAGFAAFGWHVVRQAPARPAAVTAAAAVGRSPGTAQPPSHAPAAREAASAPAPIYIEALPDKDSR